MPTVTLRVTDEEHKLWVEASGTGLLTLSAWIRETLNGALGEAGDSGVGVTGTKSPVAEPPASPRAPLEGMYNARGKRVKTCRHGRLPSVRCQTCDK